VKVENSNTQIKFLNSFMTLDEIFDSQRSPNDKSGLGYNKEEISTPKKSNTSPSFVKKRKAGMRVFVMVFSCDEYGHKSLGL
jgi:hypothetical protein